MQGTFAATAGRPCRHAAAAASEPPDMAAREGSAGAAERALPAEPCPDPKRQRLASGAWLTAGPGASAAAAGAPGACAPPPVVPLGGGPAPAQPKTSAARPARRQTASAAARRRRAGGGGGAAAAGTTSGYTGVSWAARSRKWRAQIWYSNSVRAGRPALVLGAFPARPLPWAPSSRKARCSPVR
jgi:hypothetical protein